MRHPIFASWVGRHAVLAACVMAVMILPAACGAAAPSVSPTELRAEASDDKVRRFYEQNGWQAVWSDRDAAEIERAFQGAVRHGLAPETFQPFSLPSKPGPRDVALTRAALAYAQALASGMVDPRKVHSIFTLHLNEIDVVAGLRSALADGRLRDWLETLPPTDEEYRALSEAYVEAHAAIKEGEGTKITPGRAIRPGERDPRVPALAAALSRAGHPAGDLAVDERYATQLVEAVKAFQAANGLRPDGVVGRDTMAALQEGPGRRAERLAVNLERRRWLSRAPPSVRIDVNLAAAQLRYYRSDRVTWRARVVPGSPANATPQLEETFDQLVLNPPWNVPQSIAEEEILPKGEAYLTRNEMDVVDGRIVQRPGPNAALGQVKFDMQNPYAIYLHDTPSKALFQEERRHKSHGCVRVEDAIGFARRLAQEHAREAEFDKILASRETGVVKLASPVHVRLLYHTAYLEDGQVRLVPDVYGWDGLLGERLGLGANADRRVEAATTALLGP